MILLFATIFSSCLYVVEEKLLGSYSLDPLKVVGLEGLWGFIMWCILLPIFQQIECDKEKYKELCPYGRLEDSVQAFKDYAANPTLIWLSVAVTFTMAFFNGFGVAVTKNASSAQRATIDTARTLVIWVFFLIFEVYGNKENFYWLQLGGFLLLVIGTLVFNEIIVLPFLDFDKYTKPALALRAKHDMQDYIDKNAQENDALVERRTTGANKAIQQRDTNTMNGSVIGAPETTQ